MHHIVDDCVVLTFFVWEQDVSYVRKNDMVKSESHVYCNAFLIIINDFTLSVPAQHIHTFRY